MRKTAYEKSVERIQRDGHKHCIVLYSATAMALWKHWNKKTEAIRRLFDYSLKAWNECAKDYDHSMIEMCELETGIEIQNGSGVSWRDVPYLNGSLKPDTMTLEQWTYMRQQQIKWIRPQIMACMMVALHRKYGFGFDRCSRIYGQIEDIATEYRNRPERIRKACYELTGIDVAATVTTRKERENGISEKQAR